MELPDRRADASLRRQRIATIGRLTFRVFRRYKYHRASNRHVLRPIAMALGIDPTLGQGYITGRVDKFLELRIGHLVAVDPEAIDVGNVRKPPPPADVDRIPS
jgi:hypothetical protein